MNKKELIKKILNLYWNSETGDLNSNDTEQEQEQRKGYRKAIVDILDIL